MDGDEIGAAEQLVLVDAGSAGLAGLVLGEVLAPADQLHAERTADRGGTRAQPAEPDDAERLAEEIDADRLLPPRARFEPGVLVADLSRQFEHQPERQLGGRMAGGFGAADGDVALARGR